MFARVLFLCCVSAVSSLAAATQECVDGKWIRQTDDGLPHIDCSRTPVAIRWSALTRERCSAYKRDEDWPVQDPYILRRANWHGAATLMAHRLKHKRLWWVGDSITNLFWTGVNCELARHDMVPDGVNAALRSAVDSIDPDVWESGPPFHVDHYTRTNTTLVSKGWHKVFRNEWQAMLPLADIFLFNYGLHYNNQADFESDMDWLLNLLNEWPGTAIYRELNAQHFAKSSYDAALQGGDDGTFVCGANPATVFENVVWKQNQFVRRQIEQKYKRIKILNFYNLTVPRSNLLEARFCQVEGRRSNPDAICLDCTHLTYTPQLYAKVVNDLYGLLAATKSAM